MPLYDYACTCGTVTEVFLHLSGLDAQVACGKCGEPMERQLSAVRGHGDFEAYECPITGKPIRGRRQHLENLKRHNKRVLEPGEREDLARWHRDEDRKLDAFAERIAVDAINGMSDEKRDILAGEFQHGGDAIIERRTA